MSTPSTSDSSHERCLAVVTGSTSGIGKAIAVDLAHRGFTVVINGRSQASVDSAVADVKAASGALLVLGAAGDLGTEAGCTNFITDVEALSKQHALPINVLVNNMGIFETADFFSVPDSTWQHYIDVNFFSGLRLSRHWLKDMLACGASGRILFIASETGVRIVPDMLHYSITKQMQIGLARGLAQLTKGSRVTVNSVLPGPTWTEGVEVYIQGLAKQTGVSVEDATTNYFKQREPTSLLQRFIQPAEVAAAAAFLVSEGGAAVNGAAVRCEGGLIAHV